MGVKQLYIEFQRAGHIVSGLLAAVYIYDFKHI